MKNPLWLPLAFWVAALGCGAETPASGDSEHGSAASGASAARKISLSVNGTEVAVSWEDNESVRALATLLSDGDGELVVETSRYGGFEQVGPLPRRIPGSDARMTTTAGDIVLYSGDSLVLFYGSNTWAYTKLGRIEGLSAGELRESLGAERATVKLSVSP